MKYFVTLIISIFLFSGIVHGDNAIFKALGGYYKVKTIQKISKVPPILIKTPKHTVGSIYEKILQRVQEKVGDNKTKEVILLIKVESFIRKYAKKRKTKIDLNKLANKVRDYSEGIANEIGLYSVENVFNIKTSKVVSSSKPFSDFKEYEFSFSEIVELGDPEKTIANHTSFTIRPFGRFTKIDPLDRDHPEEEIMKDPMILDSIVIDIDNSKNNNLSNKLKFLLQRKSYVIFKANEKNIESFSYYLYIDGLKDGEVIKDVTVFFDDYQTYYKEIKSGKLVGFTTINREFYDPDNRNN